MQRHTITQTLDMVGQSVTLAGWAQNIRDHGGLIFIDLRDHTGIVQLTINPENAEVFETAQSVKDEYVLKISGTVMQREESLANKNIATGTVEVVVEGLQVLNTSKPLPFPVFYQEADINEDLRLKYRFLDLRREKMQRLLRRKDEFITSIRNYMHQREFVEVTTPILTSSSPEGARDFLVPSRLHPGTFYALPQAPQQFKQLLMVGGLPKYFQIAPCFRDEDPRADRHPGEFYQLDLEVGFATSHEDVRREVEPLVIELTEKFAGKKVLFNPLPKIAYNDAMEKYGSDKPDLRFGMEMVDLSNAFQATEFSVFAAAVKKDKGCIKAIKCEGGSQLSRSQIDQLTEFVKTEGAGGLAYIVCDKESQDNSIAATGKDFYLRSPILKFLSPAEIEAVVNLTKAKAGDIIFFGADERPLVNKVLGRLRSRLADLLNLKDPNTVAWAWIVDMPFFEISEIDGKLDFAHNPFSMPIGGLEALNSADPLSIRADQYDIVANGYELCSGAIRNYNPEILYKAFEMVGYKREDVDAKFGGMIRAFEYGAPPHGGCAFGIDRWFMMLENEPNIREVIAFPKNGSAEDVMMNAPSSVTEKQLKELHIKLEVPKKKE